MSYTKIMILIQYHMVHSSCSCLVICDFPNMDDVRNLAHIIHHPVMYLFSPSSMYSNFRIVGLYFK